MPEILVYVPTSTFQQTITPDGNSKRSLWTSSRTGSKKSKFLKNQSFFL